MRTEKHILTTISNTYSSVSAGYSSDRVDATQCDAYFIIGSVNQLMQYLNYSLRIVYDLDASHLTQREITKYSKTRFSASVHCPCLYIFKDGGLTGIYNCDKKYYETKRVLIEPTQKDGAP